MLKKIQILERAPEEDDTHSQRAPNYQSEEEG